MKYTFKKVAFLLLMSCLVFSCSVEKRHYLKGYHISSVKKKNTPAKFKKSELADIKKENEIGEESIIASSDKRIILPTTKQYFSYTNSEDCDVIILKNADEIKAKIIEITETEIKYRKCGEPEGKTYSYKKSEVFMIKYPNGSKEIIKAPVENNNQNVYESVPQEKPVIEDNNKKKVNPFSLLGFIFSAAAVFAMAIFGLSFGFFAVPMILGLFGVILCIVGLIQIKKKPEKYKGKFFSVLGIVFGLIFFALSLMFFVILL